MKQLQVELFDLQEELNAKAGDTGIGSVGRQHGMGYGMHYGMRTGMMGNGFGPGSCWNNASVE